MNFILRITTRYINSEDTTYRNRAYKTYYEAQNNMIEALESMYRQIMATELTNVTGYTIEVIEWLGGNKYKNVAWIDYDLAL